MQTTHLLSDFGHDVSFANLSESLNLILSSTKSTFKVRYDIRKGKQEIKRAKTQFKKAQKLVFGGENFDVTPQNYQMARYFFDSSQPILNHANGTIEHCQKIIDNKEFNRLPGAIKSYVNLANDYSEYLISSINKLQKELTLLNSEVKPSDLPEGVRLLTEEDLWEERNNAYQFVI